MTSLFRAPKTDSTAVQLLLRAAIGGTMIAHGVKHGRSLEGTAGWFGSIGFRQPKLQAQASAVVEVGAGTAIVAGAGNPARRRRSGRHDGRGRPLGAPAERLLHHL